VPIATFFGRIHFYEGYGMDVPALLPRLAWELGVRTMIVTTAVGGVDPDLPAGTVVAITDHVNMMGVTPLRGWRYPDGMPAFIPMTEVYDRALIDLTLERAGSLGIRAAPGVYAAMAGPAFETRTELALLRVAGATVVGMSLVPEVVPARALEMRVLGLAMVTNAFGVSFSHEEVLRMSNETAKDVGKLLVDLLPRIDEGA
jgi:inosine/guanosine/xanthosine phosphorylase family protein